MRLLAKLFGSRKVTVKSALLDGQRQLFKIYGVPTPDDAQRLKAAVYLCIVATSMLNEFAGRYAKALIDQVWKESASSTETLRMLVKEIANNEAELHQVLATFPADLKISASTSINGIGAFDALYLARVKELINEIATHREGPFGVAGYASIILADGVFGAEYDKTKMFTTSVSLHTLARSLMEAGLSLPHDA